MPTSASLALSVGAYQPWTFDPRSLPGLVAWFDASDRNTLLTTSGGLTLVANNNDPVGRWADKSGLGNDVVQATGSARPSWQTGVIGGYPAVRGDGVSQYLASVALSLNATLGLTLYWVGKAVATSAFQSIVSTYAGSGTATTVDDGFDFETWTSNRWLFDRHDNDTDGLILGATAAGSDLTAPQIVAASVDLVIGKANIWVNGGAHVLDSFSALTPVHPTQLAMFRRVDAASDYFNGYTGILLIYTRAHSQLQIDTILEYLSRRTSVAVSTAL
jgi:hypothetical protein